MVRTQFYSIGIFKYTLTGIFSVQKLSVTLLHLLAGNWYGKCLEFINRDNVIVQHMTLYFAPQMKSTTYKWYTFSIHLIHTVHVILVMTKVHM